MIGLGSDHNGFLLKERIRDFLEVSGYAVRDFGAFSGETVDYPRIAAEVAEAVAVGVVARAVLVCGTGLGMSIAANKVPGVYAATASDTYTARLARESNDANVLALGARVVAADLALDLVEAWLTAEFRGGSSARKLNQIKALERRYARSSLAPLERC